MNAIVVHGGRAHADDFLAACVCLIRTGLPVFRMPCTEEMLGDSDCWVLDQGFRHEPELRNFDHHQTDAEVCSLTLVMDYFYGDSYREYFPGMRYMEILDSHGPRRAAEYAGASEDSIKTVASPIHSAVLSAFSDLEGDVKGGMIDLMGMIGSDICNKVESKDALIDCIDQGHRIRSVRGLEVLDVCGCVPPAGFSHSDLPTKLWCKTKDKSPAVILTVDTRFGGYRMVSINTESVRFSPHESSYFTHASGFMVAFREYGDHERILLEAVK